MYLDWLAAEPEQPDDTNQNHDGEAWKVLVVDDEEEVHRVTRLGLRRFRYQGRPIALLRADNSEQACKIAARHPDLAVVFLDVVMETDEAGLKVVDYIRNTLDNHLVRIIIRTGQAGRAPEISIVTKYDINGYREKTELTSDKLLSLLYTALSSYRDLLSLKNEMSRRREAANMLVKQYAKLREAYRRLEHFAKAASHDLQEPLRKMQLWVDRLISSVNTSEDQPAYAIANRVIDCSRQVSDLVEEIKLASMIESEQPHIVDVDLQALLHEIIDELKAGLEDHDADFRVDDLPGISGDRAALKLMFSNVIEAIALVNPGQEKTEVDIRLGQAGDNRIRVCIHDRGAGIEASEMAKLFEPYSKVMINGSIFSGIGLYLSKRIAEVHGGSAECRSTPGQGNEFTIELPRVQALEESAAEAGIQDTSALPAS